MSAGLFSVDRGVGRKARVLVWILGTSDGEQDPLQAFSRSKAEHVSAAFHVESEVYLWSGSLNVQGNIRLRSRTSQFF